MARRTIDDHDVIFVQVIYPGETEPRPLADWLPLVNADDIEEARR